MNTLTNTIKTTAALVVTLLLLAGGHNAFAQHHHHHGDRAEAKKCPKMAEGASMEDCPMTRDGHGHTTHTASATVELSVYVAAEADDVRVVEISVGPAGYEPSAIEIQAGVTTRLVFTRTAGAGCAEQVQIPDLGVEKTELPLGEAVTIEVTPEQPGTYRFACGMNMVRGTILVKE